MSDKAPNTYQRSNLIRDAVLLFINGQVYEGWTDIKITRELNSCAGDFSLSVVDKWRVDGEEWRIVPGEKVHLHIAGNSILTGYIDKVESSISKNSRAVTVSGRSKTGDLVDCSVENLGEFQSLSLPELAKKVCSPFGISVSFLGDAGASFDKITIQPGETVFALLDRLSRERKILMYPSFDGNLVFSNRGARRADSEIRQGHNMISGRSTFDNSNRHSIYKVNGQGLGFLGDKDQAAAAVGSATDSGITRYRPLILNHENPTNDASSGDRASYESEIRAAKSMTAEVELQGWFQSEKRLWDINELVYLDAGFLGLRRQMLIEKVQFNKGNGGTTTTLSLIRPDAYGFKKNVKKEDPLGWTKALK